MQVYGDLSELKEAIKKKYSELIFQIKKESDNQVSTLRAELDARIKQKKMRAESVLEAEEKKAYSKILSEESLKSKREFEEKREKLINKVFVEAEKKVGDLVKTKKYIDFVKKNSEDIVKNKKVEMVADSDKYKKDFSGIKTTIDKNIIGVKFMVGEVVYDFTLDGAIESKRDLIRHSVSEELFD